MKQSNAHAESTRSFFEKVDKQLQDFVKSTGETLTESVARTRRDLVRGSSASIDHIIEWNLSIESKSDVHWAGSDCNNYALTSCTVGGSFIKYWDLDDQTRDTDKPRVKK